MKVNAIKKVVAKIQKEISREINELNAGGCGWFAYMMHTELKKYNIESEMVILDQCNIDGRKEILNDIINNKSRDGWCTSFNHCCVAVKSLYFDGVTFDVISNWSERGYEPKGTYTEKEMQTALKVGGWNSDYNKSQNTVLKNIIKANLEILNNEK